MRYFRLLDDVHLEGRWHLGEVGSPGGEGVPNLLGGTPVDRVKPLSVEITRAGRQLRWCVTSFGVPVAITRLAGAISEVAGTDLQRIPLIVARDGGSFVVAHSTRVVPCLDEARSELVKWAPQDHRADLAGQYRMVTRLVLDGARIPAEAHFFRVAGWPVALIVSEAVRSAMLRVGCAGAVFQEVE